MTLLFFILIIATCGVLAFFVLIQNPKGGGLAGTFGGLGNQMMGAKQSTDVVEKGTWVTAAILLAFVLLSFITAPRDKVNQNQKTKSEEVNKGVAAPAPQPTPLPGAGGPGGAQPAANPQEGGQPVNVQPGAQGGQPAAPQAAPADAPPATKK